MTSPLLRQNPARWSTGQVVYVSTRNKDKRRGRVLAKLTISLPLPKFQAFTKDKIYPYRWGRTVDLVVRIYYVVPVRCNEISIDRSFLLVQPGPARKIATLTSACFRLKNSIKSSQPRYRPTMLGKNEKWLSLDRRRQGLSLIHI